MRLQFFILIFLGIFQAIFGIEVKTLNEVLLKNPAPFNYDLHIKIIPGSSQDENVMVCCHGYGSNYDTAEAVKSSQAVPQHLVGFNFPDHDINERGFDPSNFTFGSIQELLPLIYILDKIVVEGRAKQISLYGFSAGGGAVVNVIGVLNTHEYDNELQKIGLNAASKAKILNALQKGVIILDAPLKSIEEIMRDRVSPKYLAIANQYKKNHFRPIDTIPKWKGLSLTVILFFQNPDECLTNREDQIFITRLKQANPNGNNIILIKDEGGHCGYHDSLWKAYRSLLGQVGQ